jgi:hypothetical protein
MSPAKKVMTRKLNLQFECISSTKDQNNPKYKTYTISYLQTKKRTNMNTNEKQNKKLFIYFVVPESHAPSCALRIGAHPHVRLYVGLSGTAAQRPPESPSWCAGFEPANSK